MAIVGLNSGAQPIADADNDAAMSGNMGCQDLKGGGDTKFDIFWPKINILKENYWLSKTSKNMFSKFSCMFLNPNNFFQFEF